MTPTSHQSRDEPDNPVHSAPTRGRIESIFWTCKELGRPSRAPVDHVV